jgi:hypothetical protein
MADEAEYYTTFADMLRGAPAQTLSPWVRKVEHVSRLAIHQGNFRITTTNAMRGLFKAVERLVGAEYFDALIASFMREHPPELSSLTHYGADFADFLRKFAPVQKDLPWLSPIAQLDWAWFTAYKAANTPALSAKSLQGVAAELLPASAPGLHGSAVLLRFSVPAYSIWKTNIEDDAVQEVALDKGREWAMIWRQDMRIRHQALSRAQYVFLDAIGGNKSLAEAWTDARQHDAHFELSKEFAHWLNAGVFNGEHHDQNK